MDNNWVVENLNNSLNTWNSKMTEIWQIVTQSPQNFKGRSNMECDNYN